MVSGPFSVEVKPDWEGLVKCIRREGTPKRVHYIELFLDGEIQAAICERYELARGLNPNNPFYAWQKEIRLQRFLGYDYIGRHAADGLTGMPTTRIVAEDTAALARKGGRSFVDEHKGPITNWEEFEKYPWPDPAKQDLRNLEWLQKNLPDDMCIVVRGGAHYCEYLCWLMGYETLCYALHEQRDLVAAIRNRLEAIYRVIYPNVLQFDRVKIIWGSDDMGFKTGPLISPSDMREFVLRGHKESAQIAHDAGRVYLLHSCGDLSTIMGDLINDVRIDAKHSFEDVIEPVTVAKDRYGDRIALLGGIDVDFLCRADEAQIRKRVRETLDTCQPGGGYCLGTGNSVANYIPVDNYLAMMDEGRKHR
jgi:uroporphyrinogen decarboxylase